MKKKTTTTTTPTTWVEGYGLTKLEQADLAAVIINKVAEGTLNALEAKLYLKSAEAVIGRAMEAIDYEARREAEKYGEKSFKVKGVKVELATTGVKYDFTLCNDEELKTLEQAQAELKKKIDARRKFLQSIEGSLTLVDETTGEVRKLYAPIKSSNDGLKITFE
jgi:hypothetical protein